MNNTIGKNLGMLRRQLGITQAQLAEAVNVTTEHIVHVESGHSNLSLERLKLICNVLNVTPNDIMAGEYKTKEGSNINTLSLDNMEPEDRLFMYKISYYFKNKNNSISE